jgi:hypothetical protein
MRRSFLLFCVVVFFSSTANASLQWQSYDGFSGTVLDTSKWLPSFTREGRMPVVDNGIAKLDVGDDDWFSHSTLEVLNTSVMGIQADIAMSNVDITGANGRANLELELDFGNNYSAAARIHYDDTGFVLEYGILHSHETVSEYLIVQTGYSSGDVVNLGVALKNGVVEFYRDGSYFNSFDDELTQSFVTQAVTVDAWTYECCSNNTVDNVSVLIPEPATLLLLGLGAMLLRKRKSLTC